MNLNYTSMNLISRCHEILMPKNLDLQACNRFWVWLASGLPDRPHNSTGLQTFDTQSRGYETSWNLTICTIIVNRNAFSLMILVLNNMHSNFIEMNLYWLIHVEVLLCVTLSYTNCCGHRDFFSIELTPVIISFSMKIVEHGIISCLKSVLQQ